MAYRNISIALAHFVVADLHSLFLQHKEAAVAAHGDKHHEAEHHVHAHLAHNKAPVHSNVPAAMQHAAPAADSSTEHKGHHSKGHGHSGQDHHHGK